MKYICQIVFVYNLTLRRFERYNYSYEIKTHIGTSLGFTPTQTLPGLAGRVLYPFKFKAVGILNLG